MTKSRSGVIGTSGGEMDRLEKENNFLAGMSEMLFIFITVWTCILSKCTGLYIIDGHNLLYISYTSVKWTEMKVNK